MTSATCRVCGNQYDKAMEIRVGGRTGTYDCFECAIHDLAPICAHCEVRIMGHGVEADGAIFCGAHCAGKAGKKQLQDRA